MILFGDRTTNIMSLVLGRKQLQLVGGSPISEKELWACAAAILKRYGAGARDEVNRRIDKMNADGDFAGHATWVNIALCLIALTLAAEDETRH